MDARTSLTYPKLYTPGLRNTMFNRWVFLKSLAEGILTSLVVFFISYGVFRDSVFTDGRSVDGLLLFGTIVASILIIVVTLRVRTTIILLL